MLSFEENVSLKPYNTFGIEAQTKYFYKVEDPTELQHILTQNKELPFRIFGGGSNVLLTQNFEGLSLLIANKGVELLDESSTGVTLEVQAGENWHDFVLWCLDQK